MHVSTADATSYGIMVGVGETYLPAFALAVGLGEVTAGLVASVPLLAGGVLQSVSPWILRRGISEKAWILTTALLQAVAFLPLILASLGGGISTLWLLVFASMYWTGGLATGPAWNSWITKIIPKAIRTNYFAHRTRASQLATLIGFLGGGFLLQYSQSLGWEVLAFAALFGAALVSRVFSVWMLWLHQQTSWVARIPSVQDSPPARVAGEGLKFKPSIEAKHLIIYLVLVQGMVQISGPFFTPYMLMHLELSYMAYAGLIAVAFLAKIIAVGAWGQLAQRRGAQWLLTVGGAAIVPLSSLWIVSESYTWLITIQAVNGAAWAAYELGFFLMFFESMPSQRRIKMLTVYNLANTSAWWIGSMIGAAILQRMGSSPQAYYTLFVVSSCGRCLAFAYLVTHRQQVFVRVREIGFRVLGVRVNAAPLESPILSTLDAATPRTPVPR